MLTKFLLRNPAFAWFVLAKYLTSRRVTGIRGWPTARYAAMHWWDDQIAVNSRHAVEPQQRLDGLRSPTVVT